MQQDEPGEQDNSERESEFLETIESSDEQLAYENPTAPRGRFFLEGDATLLADCLTAKPRVELEIGSGKGLFLINASRAHPETQWIGLEIAAKYAWECQNKVERTQLTNVRFFASDAVAVLECDIPDASLDAIHCYFPDPWWKAKHKKRRVLNDQTLRNIERALKAGGSFHFWTDVLDYYELTLERIDQATSLLGPYFVGEPPANHDMDYRTHFERRTRRNGLPVYRSRFEKGRTPSL